MPRPNLGPRIVPLRKPGRPLVYVVRYYDDNGKRRMHSTGASDPGQAERAFEVWREERARKRRAGPGHPSKILIRHVLMNYSEEHGEEVASPETLAYALEPMLEFFGRETMAQLTTRRVKEYWTWRRGHGVRVVDDVRGVHECTISDGTIIRELAGTLRPAIRHAIAEKRLDPGTYAVPVPATPPGRDYWITRSEAARLLRETRRDKRSRLHLPLYTLIALYTGQRRGAILDLTWKQVDLVAGRINFNPPGRAQTKKARPHIPTPRSLLAALRRAQKRASSEYVISYDGEKVGSVKKGFSSAAARAGIPGCTSHTLRHSAGTLMAQRGVPLHEIAGYLGHSLQRTTELYLHHSPSFMSNARKAFE
jgi:integrase